MSDEAMDALRFYAARENYDVIAHDPGDGSTVETGTLVSRDGGKRARAALDSFHPAPSASETREPDAALSYGREIEDREARGEVAVGGRWVKPAPSGLTKEERAFLDAARAMMAAKREDANRPSQDGTFRTGIAVQQTTAAAFKAYDALLQARAQGARKEGGAS